MAKSLAEELGARLSNIESRLNALSGNRLDHASLDGSTLYLKDSDGNLQGRLGRQPDGSNGVHVVRVQPPPQLTAAILTVGEQAGTCLVEWDGGTFDGRRMPLIHGHTEIWAELVGDDWSPTVAPGGSAKRVGTIRDRTGGEVVVALPQTGMWAVWLRAMGADRETAGPWSPVSTVEIKPLVDTEAIEAELEDARDRIEQAEQELAAGMADRVAEIEHLREVRIPALQDALATGLDDVYREAQQYAESQADNAVNQAAANAQSEYDRLQEIAERALSRAGDNVLEDPSFETDYWFDNWPSSALPASPSSSARTGDQSAAVVRASGSTASTNVTLDSIDVEPDDSWRFSVWYRTPDNADLDYGNFPTIIRVRNAANNSVLADSTPLMVTDEWSRAVVTATIPDGVDQISAVVRFAHTEGTLLLDDIAFQEVGAAAEALRLAEVARQEAEAAHIAAGNAVDTAANAYDAASSKNTVHWSLSAPSGTADNSDDVWWQYELRNGRRVVIGQWFWDNGVWRETEIAEEWLPQVNIGTGTYGDMSGDRLTANTVHANKMLVGPRNIITDLDFSQVDAGSIEDGWGSYTGGWERTAVAWSDQQAHFASIISGHESDSGMKALHYGGSGPSSASLPCEPGERFKVRFQVVRYVGWSDDDNYRAEFRWVDSNGNGIGWSRFQFGSGYGNQSWVEFEALAPAGATRFYFRFSKNGAAAGRRGVGNLSIQSMTGSDLIVQGAVKSHSVDTEEFFAAEAVIQKIWTDIVRSRLIQSEGIITEDMIATGAVTTPKLTVTEEMVAEVVKVMRLEGDEMDFNIIRGMIIEAAQIQGSVFRAEGPDGEETVRLDGMDNYLRGSIHAGVSENSQIDLDHGPVTVQRADGTSTVYDTTYISFNTEFSTLTPRIWVDPDAGSLYISAGGNSSTPAFRGRVRVGGDLGANRLDGNQLLVRGGNEQAEGFTRTGGMLNSSGQVRVVGQHASSVSSQDMVVMGDGGVAREVSPTGSYRADIVYGAPSDGGSRRPMVSTHMSNTSHDGGRMVSTTTARRGSAAFETRSRQIYNTASGNASFFLYYHAAWD